MCNVCRQYKEKNELIRITKDYKTGEIMVNTDNIIQGRSIYVCKNEECIKKFIKNKKSLCVLKAEKPVNIEEMLCTVLKK